MKTATDYAKDWLSTIYIRVPDGGKQLEVYNRQLAAYLAGFQQSYKIIKEENKRDNGVYDKS